MRTNPFVSTARSAFLAAALLVAAASAADNPPRLPHGTAEGHFRTQEPAEATASAPAVQPGSYAALLARVTPAVVSVFPARLIKEAVDNDPLGRFFSLSKEDATKESERIQGLGSGVILSSDGWIVTNSHVVHLANGRVAEAISVELSDRRRFPARVAGVDPPTDLALLKIGATNLPSIAMADSDSVQIGDLVFAIGNPFKVGMTATMGMVSAKHRSVGINGAGGFEDFVQTDAAINPGNSGGALVDASGRLVGINSAIYGGCGGNVGIGFAIPTNLVRQIIVRLAEEGKVTRGFLGLQLEEVDADAAAGARLDRIRGAKVSAVMDGGPAAIAGLKSGDIILKAAGRDVETRAMLRMVLSLVKPAAAVPIELNRAGQRQTITITAKDNPESNDPGTFELASLPGVKFRMRDNTLVVANVNPEAARKMHLEVGMEIVEINGETAVSATAVENAFRRGVNKLKTRSDDGERTLVVRVE